MEKYKRRDWPDWEHGTDDIGLYDVLLSSTNERSVRAKVNEAKKELKHVRQMFEQVNDRYVYFGSIFEDDNREVDRERALREIMKIVDARRAKGKTAYTNKKMDIFRKWQASMKTKIEALRDEHAKNNLLDMVLIRFIFKNILFPGGLSVHD